MIHSAVLQACFIAGLLPGQRSSSTVFHLLSTHTTDLACSHHQHILLHFHRSHSFRLYVSILFGVVVVAHGCVLHDCCVVGFGAGHCASESSLPSSSLH